MTIVLLLLKDSENKPLNERFKRVLFYYLLKNEINITIGEDKNKMDTQNTHTENETPFNNTLNGFKVCLSFDGRGKINPSLKEINTQNFKQQILNLYSLIGEDFKISKEWFKRVGLIQNKNHYTKLNHLLRDSKATITPQKRYIKKLGGGCLYLCSELLHFITYK